MSFRVCALIWVLCGLVTPAQSSEEIRLVTADGSITEIVYKLGLESLLVGVDTTSSYPKEVQSLPKIGYLRALPFEGVLALKPDFLITSEQAAPEENLDRLARAGVRVEKLPVAWSPQAALQRIETVGALLGHAGRAEAIVTELESEIGRIEQASASRGYRPRVLFILAAGGSHSVMLAGEGTAAEALLDALDADNAVSGVQGYKPANREAIMASRPDAIIVAESRPGQFDVAAWPALQRLGAWQSGHRLVDDSMKLLGFGPRLPEAMAAVNDMLSSVPNVAGNDS